MTDNSNVKQETGKDLQSYKKHQFYMHTNVTPD